MRPDAPQARPVAQGRSVGRQLARSVALSLLVAPLCAYWAQAEPVCRIFSLMVPPVVFTLAAVAANVPLRLKLPRFALTEAELVTFYAMQSVVCAMASEWVDVVHPVIYSYGLFSERSERYQRVLPHLSDWLFFRSREGLEDFATGGWGPMHTFSRLPLWLPKIAAWTLIVSLAAIAMLCINSLMREQWTIKEKLAFPLIQVPLAITEGAGNSPFWRRRELWFSAGIMFSIDILNGLAFLYPALPSINVRFLADASDWLHSPPWNQIGWTPVGLFPFMAALGLFMPADLLFSCVFFFFVRKAQQVAAASLGHEQGVFGGGGLVPGAPYFSEQSWGAFIALFCLAAWVGRGHIRTVWKQVVAGGPTDRRVVPARWAFAGLVVSILALDAIGIALGLPPVFVLAYTAVFLVFSVALTRLRAQLGPPSHEMAFMGPNQLVVGFKGTQGLGDSFLAKVVTTFHFMNRIHRTHPMPHQLEAMKMGERYGMSQRALFIAILIATIAGCVLGHLSRLGIQYRWGPGDGAGETANVIALLGDSERPPNVSAMLAVAAGFGVVITLDAIRFRVPGFPFHPAGYALGMNFGVDYYWFGLLVALLVKLFVQRYWGLRGHDRLRVVAIGIVIGEFVAEAIWASMAMVTRSATYTISINGRLGWDQ
ncbi:MAG TPA: DUF6785 family protein [Chthonomonadales bacterium]|nr:DUF6785 family protein [Chthonomonadales bacterium]